MVSAAGGPAADFEDGEYAGTISGGCLEAEVDSAGRRGWCAMAQWWSGIRQRLMILAEVPFGLGCGGMLDLLLEPAGTAECWALMEATEGALEGRGSKVVTWLPGDGKGLRRAVIGTGWRGGVCE